MSPSTRRCRSEFGVSKAWGAWIVDGAPSVTYYTDNDAFLSGGTRAQQPIVSVQRHIVRSFGYGIRAALDGTYYTDGRMIINGA
jgi:hypothetical protein